MHLHSAFRNEICPRFYSLVQIDSRNVFFFLSISPAEFLMFGSVHAEVDLVKVNREIKAVSYLLTFGVF